MNQLQQTVQQSQKELMEHFKLENQHTTEIKSIYDEQMESGSEEDFQFRSDLLHKGLF